MFTAKHSSRWIVSLFSCLQVIWNCFLPSRVPLPLPACLPISIHREWKQLDLLLELESHEREVLIEFSCLPLFALSHRYNKWLTSSSRSKIALISLLCQPDGWTRSFVMHCAFVCLAITIVLTFCRCTKTFALVFETCTVWSSLMTLRWIQFIKKQDPFNAVAVRSHSCIVSLGPQQITQ